MRGVIRGDKEDDKEGGCSCVNELIFHLSIKYKADITAHRKLP